MGALFRQNVATSARALGLKACLYFLSSFFLPMGESFAAWYPALVASASVMYWPCFVFPYHSSPSRWKTLVELLAQTLPLPPPGAAVIVDGSTGGALGAFIFFSVFAGASVVAGAACAKQRLEAIAKKSGRANNLAFTIFTVFSLWITFDGAERHSSRSRITFWNLGSCGRRR